MTIIQRITATSQHFIKFKAYEEIAPYIPAFQALYLHDFRPDGPVIISSNSIILPPRELKVLRQNNIVLDNTTYYYDAQDLDELRQKVMAKLEKSKLYPEWKVTQLFNPKQFEAYTPQWGQFGVIKVFAPGMACYNDGSWKHISMPIPKLSQKQMRSLVCGTDRPNPNP